MASFSSRGPQSINLNILKVKYYLSHSSLSLSLSHILIANGQPDIAAPGLDILAAYSTLASVTGDPTDKRHAVFNIISGTSMACPHAAAAAAYVKSFHPDWSPAAIKSALMTTGKTSDPKLNILKFWTPLIPLFGLFISTSSPTVPFVFLQVIISKLNINCFSLNQILAASYILIQVIHLKRQVQVPNSPKSN